MTREQAINSYKISNEQTKLNIQAHRHIMDTSEIRELEWYIERDEMAIKALEQKTGHWTRELIRNDKGGCIGARMICSNCGKDNKHDERMSYCPNCGAKMESEG